MIQYGAKVAAEQLRKMGLGVRIDTRVVGRHEKSDRTVMTVTGDVEEEAILKVLKKNEVEYATVGSQIKGDKKVRTIRLVQKPIREAVAEPFKKFKKGQIVTVKKTGKKVEVLSQNDIGLVQTVSTDKDDLKIKSWRDHSAATLKRGLISGAGHQEYMPRELQEGWKTKTAAVALAGAVVAGIANSPKVEINGATYDKAISLSSAPADAKSTTVKINGKDTKVLYWDAIGPKHNRTTKVYAKAE